MALIIRRRDRQREDRLGEDRAGEQQTELQADHGDDRDKRVAQHVLQHDAPLRQAFRRAVRTWSCERIDSISERVIRVMIAIGIVRGEGGRRDDARRSPEMPVAGDHGVTTDMR